MRVGAAVISSAVISSRFDEAVNMKRSHHEEPRGRLRSADTETTVTPCALISPQQRERKRNAQIISHANHTSTSQLGLTLSRCYIMSSAGEQAPLSYLCPHI